MVKCIYGFERSSMERFFNDLKKYKSYILYTAWAELKVEVVSSYLGWIWLILEPLCFMFIYMFIAGVVFKTKVEYFPIFVFIGLTIWNFFNKMVVTSVRLIAANKGIITKVYLPKFILLFIKLFVNIFKMLISFSLVIIFMIIYKVPVTWNVLWFIPIVISAIVFTFGVCTILMHFGVFAEDLVNIVNIGLRMVFYMTGVFYDISTRVTNVVYRTILLELNPLANYIYNLRNVLIYERAPVGIWTLFWFFIGIFLTILGVRLIYKYENTYVKVMRS